MVKSSDDYAQSTRFAIWTILLAFQLSIGVFLIFGFLKFKRMRSLIIVQKRYPGLVLLESILSIIVTMFFEPLYVTQSIDLFPEHRIFIYRSAISVAPFFHTIIWCEVCRLWLIGYDINFAHSVAHRTQCQWQTQISSRFGTRDWWLAHRDTFGNFKLMSRILLTYSVVSGCLVVALYQVFTYESYESSKIRVIGGVLYVIPTIALLYVYCKCPKTSKDAFLLRYELNRTVFLFVYGIVVYSVTVQILQFFDKFIANVITSICSTFIFSSLSILSTFWIPRKILSEGYWQDVYTRATLEAETGPKKSTDTDWDALIALFADPQRLNLFALHLTGEYSLEVLLSFIEFMQFKQRMNEIYYRQSGDVVMLESDAIRFDFGTTEPIRSDIVYQQFDHDGDVDEKQTLRELTCIARKLFEKYIDEGCELEINIASRCRAKYKRLMQNENRWIENDSVTASELLAVFDEACIEMLKLMHDSFTRFTNQK